MTPFRAITVLIVVAVLIAGREMWKSVVTPAEAHVFRAVSHTTSVPDSNTQDKQDQMRDDDVARPDVDLFGNEVDKALGDYRVDIRGDIYERHSPDTEVPKLRPAVG